MRLRKLQHEGVISKLERKLDVKQRLVAVGAKLERYDNRA